MLEKNSGLQIDNKKILVLKSPCHCTKNKDYLSKHYIDHYFSTWKESRKSIVSGDFYYHIGNGSSPIKYYYIE